MALRQYEDPTSLAKKKIREMEAKMNLGKYQSPVELAEQNLDDISGHDHLSSKRVRHREWKILDNGQRVEYHCNSHASVMEDEPLNKEGVNKFTIEVDRNHNHITLGVAPKDFNMENQVGSDENSWGFNLYTGHLVHDGETNVKYGRRIFIKKKVTLILDREAGTLGLKIGSENFGPAFKCNKLKKLELYPVISTGVDCTTEFIQGKEVNKAIEYE